MKYIFTLLFILIIAICPGDAQTPVIQYQPIATGLSEPLDIVSPADGTGRLFIVQQGGTIRIWDGTNILPAVFLDVSSQIVSGGERGLLSMAFHPQYADNRYFFIYYTKAGTGALTVARYRTAVANPNLADPTSGMEIISIPHPSNANHNGGKLNFGTDGYLYFATGDGGGTNDVPNNAQTGSTLLGKMLRIDVNDFADVTAPLYTVPASNPYIGNPNVNDEIIALGLRNPFRWSFDRVTGDMWIGDVGQNAREEVDFRSAQSILAPTNYGWRCFEGFITNPSPTAACAEPPNYVPPVFDYGRGSSDGGFAITGGFVYRGSEFPALQGYYITTDFGTGNIWLIQPAPGGGFTATLQTRNKISRIAGFGEAADGTLYAVRLNNGVSDNTGVLYKITTDAILPIRLISFIGTTQDDMHFLEWELDGTNAGDIIVVERKALNDNEFRELLRKYVASVERNGNTQTPAIDNGSLYRLKIISADGSIVYSPVISLRRVDISAIRFTAYVAAGSIYLHLLAPATAVQVFDGQGKVFYSKNLSGQQGLIKIPVNDMATGVKYLRVFAGGNSEVKKLIW